MEQDKVINMLMKSGLMGAFLKKHSTYIADLAKDLSQLRTVYGDDVVNAVIGDIEKGQIAIGLIKSTIIPSSPVSLTVTNKKHLDKKQRRRPRKIHDKVGFTELKPLVVEVVKSLQGKRFTIQDVKGILEFMKVKFDPKHLHLILPRYLTGLVVVDKQKRKGFPMNVYEINGEVTLLRYTTASNNK